MAEDVRSKAVEEALRSTPGGSWIIYDKLQVVRAFKLLWQRAQEAEREENCKAVCALCRKQGKPECRVGGPHRSVDWYHAVEEIPGLPYDSRCGASEIRDRAARASEEPKSHQMTLIDTCYGMTGGDLYVCPHSQNRTVVRPGAEAPTCEGRASEEGSR